MSRRNEPPLGRGNVQANVQIFIKSLANRTLLLSVFDFS